MPINTSKTPKMVVIVGETASGKSSLAMAVAKKFNGEIICADSSTIRKGFDIGSAKPSPEEQKQIKHHLLDVADPDEIFSAAKFKNLAQKAIIQISNKGKLPIMVGGSGLYVDSVLFDYQFLPASDHKERELLAKLSVKDLISVAKGRKLDISEIDTANKVRLIRFIQTNGQLPKKRPLRKNTLIIGLKSNREDINKQITARTEQMIEQGLADEVEKIVEHYGWNCEGLKAVGYREWQDHFLGKKSLEKTKFEIIKDTKYLAKKQRTWFRRNKFIHWTRTPVNQAEVVELITTFLDK